MTLSGDSAKRVELFAAMEHGRLRVFAKLRGPILMNRTDIAHEDITDSFARLAGTVGPTLARPSGTQGFDSGRMP
jgi:hypothetical protein